MQNDVNGCSTCPAGQERFNIYWSPLAQDMRTQYDYRTPEGKLFSCIANSLEDAHAKRDAWLQEEEQAQRQHRHTEPVGDGLILTLRKNAA